MNYNYISQGGNKQYNVVDLVVDTDADVADLPTNVAPGSTCFVVDTSKAYMFKISGEWKELEQRGLKYGYNNISIS